MPATQHLVTAFVSWAHGDSSRIEDLKTERDNLVQRVLSGKGDLLALTSSTLNGKSFGFQLSLNVTDKLELITDVLDALGELPAGVSPVTTTYGAFSSIQR